ncbi:MAG: Omp28-related outer membrane protein [Bacteroidetes bacterium]|nr:Omp28-related outer membrane protein [Bacteroidota bacterium]MDA0860454.1 Omp28-related outer membrane protein [Bacteroidota bacterium]MDA1318666.1 Omp28-related outer membrane protein [Bacteroidota bacterium]
MKNVFKIQSILCFFLVLSCSSNEEAASENQNIPDNSVTSINLTFNKDSYYVGEYGFYVVRDNQNNVITDDASVTVNNVALTVNPYNFENPGSYTFVATYENVTSNSVTFEVESASEYSDTSSFSSSGAPATFTKKVLLEDFTGTWCPNCPPAAAAVESAVDGNPNIFGVGYHDGDPMQIEETMFWTNYYHVTAFPTVYVNGPDTRWNFPNMAQVNSELAEEAIVGLALEGQIIGGKLDLEVNVGFKTSPNEEVKLMIYLIEATQTSDSPQAGSSQGVNYVHNDVLLEVYTDKLGDVIPSNNTNAGGVYTRTITGLDLPSSVIDVNNLKLVAFVRNTYTKTFVDYFNTTWENSPHYDIYNVQEVHLGESVAFD